MREGDRKSHFQSLALSHSRTGGGTGSFAQKVLHRAGHSPGHTCVAARTVFGPPPGEMTGLGLVAWKRERGGWWGDNLRSYPACDMTHPFLALALIIQKLVGFPPLTRNKKCLATLGREETDNFTGKEKFHPTSERKWKFGPFLWGVGNKGGPILLPLWGKSECHASFKIHEESMSNSRCIRNIFAAQPM